MKVSSQMTTMRTGTDQRGRSTSILSNLSSHPQSASSVLVDRSSPDVISEEQSMSDLPTQMELKVGDEERIRYSNPREFRFILLNSIGVEKFPGGSDSNRITQEKFQHQGV